MATKKDYKDIKKPVKNPAGSATSERKFIIKVVGTVLGVLFLQLALGASYLIAFHAPKAHDVPVAVVGPTEQVDQLAKIVESESNGAYKVSVIDTVDNATKQIQEQKIYAAYVPGAAKSQQSANVIVASAASQSLAQSIPQSFQAISTKLQTGQTTTDIAPLPENDSRGLGMFYTAFTWVFGGYLAAAALSIVRGQRAFTFRNALVRLAGFVVFAFLGSAFMALIATQGVGVFSGDFYWQLVGLGTLTTTATALAACAIISAIGTVGTGVVIILFVILGNPASGGVVPLSLVGNGPWQWFAHILPTGAAIDAIKSAVYFSGANLLQYLQVLAIYCVVGMVAILTLGLRKTTISYYESQIADK